MGLGSLVYNASAPSSLKKLIEVQYTTVEDVAWLTADSWVRGSKLAEICPREEVLVSAAKLIRKREISPDLNMALEAGKALHYQLQNSILPSVGVILGEWECLACKLHVGKQEYLRSLDSVAVKRPDKCVCGETAFLFHEYSLANEGYRITGHTDGLLSIVGVSGLGVLEFKTIAPNGAWEVKNVPKLDHAIQAHIYMWLTGLTWAKILYWDKGTYGMSGMIEHTLEQDDETIEMIKSTLAELWDGIRTGIPPVHRVCAHSEAPRAEACVVSKPCFASSESVSE